MVSGGAQEVMCLISGELKVPVSLKKSLAVSFCKENFKDIKYPRIDHTKSYRQKQSIMILFK